ncbi:MAG: glycosyltransferase family 39 protein [Limisphaerales bacterium]
MTLQECIHHLEEGAGAGSLKVVAVLLAFVAFACLYDLPSFQGFASEEPMETAQLARNLSQGRGYVTKSIRPLSIALWQKKAGPAKGQRSVPLPMPDLNNPPLYPLLLAGVMKVLPFHFTATDYWFYQPERLIAVFNQLIFFAAVLLLFRIARRLFGSSVAWVSSILFAATNLFWKFSVSGLSTLLLLLIFLALLSCLMRIEERERAAPGGAGMGWALLAGALTALGGLTRYAFAWMVIPVVLFVAWVAPRSRARLCLPLVAAMAVLVVPWLARNYSLSGNLFGEASYALVEGTPPLEGDHLERSFSPENALQRVTPLDVADKFISNAYGMWRDDLPRFGGNWVSAFFLVGLLIPFREPSVRRTRVFLVFSLVLLFVVQAFGQTHLSADSPEINSENLLPLLAPLVFVYGTALFFMLFDRLNLAIPRERRAVIGAFVFFFSVPFITSSLLLAHGTVFNSIFSPLHIQGTAELMEPQELMMSDIPGAVAWYGDRNCAWLTLDNDQEFLKLNKLELVKALLLTQKTTNQRFLSEMILEPFSWSQFVMECQAQGRVPEGFPLTKLPAGFLPYQMFLSGKDRWGSSAKRED